MDEITKNIIWERLKNESLYSETIAWSAPVISFGDVTKSIIATIGINPSNREFESLNGVELKGAERRFHTLNSLKIKTWRNLDSNHYNRINKYCFNYFIRNPYDAWFKKLDYIISGTAKSYYFPSQQACHLDLIPWATSKKWSDINKGTQSSLLLSSGNFLGEILRNSDVKVLVLNGQTVVTNLEKIANRKLSRTEVLEWRLKRRRGNDVKGYKYEGSINQIGGIYLGKKIRVLGFNYNIQSSYGLTKEVMLEIRNWITNELKNTL